MCIVKSDNFLMCLCLIAAIQIEVLLFSLGVRVSR